MDVRSVALLKVGKDYGVVMFEMKIVGLRELDEDPKLYIGDVENIEAEILRVVPEISSMPHSDILVEDNGRRMYLVRLYLGDGRVEYALIISPRNSVKGLIKKLLDQRWALRFLVEQRKVAKQSYWR